MMISHKLGLFLLALAIVNSGCSVTDSSFWPSLTGDDPSGKTEKADKIVKPAVKPSQSGTPSVVDATPTRVVISEAGKENSPSEKAGVKAGDIILEFNGERIQEMKQLPIIVARTKVGKKVKVKIWRDKKEIVKIIELGRLETSEDFKVAEKEKPSKEKGIDGLKIFVRELREFMYDGS